MTNVVDQEPERQLSEQSSLSEVVAQLTKIVRGLVEEEDAVSVEAEDLGHTVVLKVSVAAHELGRVIGREGRTVRAIRTLLEARSLDDDTYYDVEIVEP